MRHDKYDHKTGKGTLPLQLESSVFRKLKNKLEEEEKIKKKEYAKENK